MMKTRKQWREALTKQSTEQEPEAGSINHWSRLSDEMVLFIFRLLPQEDLVTVSLINKKFRDLSRDASLWTELTLGYEDIKRSEDSCRKLVDRCTKLTKLKITSESASFKRSVDIIMSVVIRAKKSLKSLVIDSSIRKWTDVALERFGELKELRSISVTIEDLRNYHKGRLQLTKLDHLEELCVKRGEKGYFATRWYDDRRNVLQQFKKLKKVDIWFADANIVAALTRNNPNLEVLRLQHWRVQEGTHWFKYQFVDHHLLHKLRSKYPGIDIERSTYTTIHRRRMGYDMLIITGYDEE